MEMNIKEKCVEMHINCIYTEQGNSLCGTDVLLTAIP